MFENPFKNKKRAREPIQEKKPEISFKTLDSSNIDLLSAIVSLEKKVFGNKESDLERLKQKLLRGEVIYTLWNGDKAVGMATALASADIGSSNLLKKNLPNESVFAGAAAIDPAFRGQGLQKDLLKQRIEFVGQLNKETLLGTVRPENGASLRNISSVGGRIIGYSPNFFPESKIPARLVWEIDNKVRQSLDWNPSKEFPDIAVDIKSSEKTDFEAQQAISKILGQDYVGIKVETPESDKGKIPSSSRIIFRHLSNFPLDIEERLRERKRVIGHILRPKEKDSAVKVEIATEDDLEEIRKLRQEAVTDSPSSFDEDSVDVSERSVKEWKDIVFGEKNFVILGKLGSEAIGMLSVNEDKSLAYEKGGKKIDNVWYIRWGYLKPEFRRKSAGFALKGLEESLKEIKRRGGEAAVLMIKASNENKEAIVKIGKKFGFEIIEGILKTGSTFMRLDLTKSP